VPSARVELTVFRKLKELGYLTSYSQGGRFYTLREIARFGADGLWSRTPAASGAIARRVTRHPDQSRTVTARAADPAVRNVSI